MSKSNKTKHVQFSSLPIPSTKTSSSSKRYTLAIAPMYQEQRIVDRSPRRRSQLLKPAATIHATRRATAGPSKHFLRTQTSADDDADDDDADFDGGYEASHDAREKRHDAREKRSSLSNASSTSSCSTSLSSVCIDHRVAPSAAATAAAAAAAADRSPPRSKKPKRLSFAALRPGGKKLPPPKFVARLRKQLSYSSSSSVHFRRASVQDFMETEGLTAQGLLEDERDLPVLTGFLDKRSPNLFAGWQRRWFAVSQYNILYSANEEEKLDLSDVSNGLNKGMRCLPMFVVFGIFPLIGNEGREFCVKGRDMSKGIYREYILRAPTQDERDRWVSGLRRHKDHLDALLKCPDIKLRTYQAPR